MASLRIHVLVLAGAMAAPASGADLYRCVSASGAVSYQDAPCGAGSQLSRTIPVLVEPVSPQAPKRAASPAKTKSSKSATTKTGSKGSDPRGKQRTACAQARKKRDAALDRMGLKRTFDTLRALDDEVHEACKGL